MGNHVVIIKDKFNFINKITIKNDNNTKVFRIHRFFIEDTLNFIDMYIMTNDGVIGLADQVGTSLFLEDGVYSLWDVENKAQRRDGKLPGKNVYGVHPFLMGKCEDDSWVGIYTNLAAAQDWWIKSHSTSDEKNETRASVYATGGVGDISIIFGKTPEEVV